MKVANEIHQNIKHVDNLTLAEVINLQEHLSIPICQRQNLTGICFALWQQLDFQATDQNQSIC